MHYDYPSQEGEYDEELVEDPAETLHDKSYGYETHDDYSLHQDSNRDRPKEEKHDEYIGDIDDDHDLKNNHDIILTGKEIEAETGHVPHIHEGNKDIEKAKNIENFPANVEHIVGREHVVVSDRRQIEAYKNNFPDQRVANKHPTYNSHDKNNGDKQDILSDRQQIDAQEKHFSDQGGTFKYTTQIAHDETNDDEYDIISSRGNFEVHEKHLLDQIETNTHATTQTAHDVNRNRECDFNTDGRKIELHEKHLLEQGKTSTHAPQIAHDESTDVNEEHHIRREPDVVVVRKGIEANNEHVQNLKENVGHTTHIEYLDDNEKHIDKNQNSATPAENRIQAHQHYGNNQQNNNEKIVLKTEHKGNSNGNEETLINKRGHAVILVENKTNIYDDLVVIDVKKEKSLEHTDDNEGAIKTIDHDVVLVGSGTEIHGKYVPNTTLNREDWKEDIKVEDFGKEGENLHNITAFKNPEYFKKAEPAEFSPVNNAGKNDSEQVAINGESVNLAELVHEPVYFKLYEDYDFLSQVLATKGASNNQTHKTELPSVDFGAKSSKIKQHISPLRTTSKNFPSVSPLPISQSITKHSRLNLTFYIDRNTLYEGQTTQGFQPSYSTDNYLKQTPQILSTSGFSKISESDKVEDATLSAISSQFLTTSSSSMSQNITENAKAKTYQNILYQALTHQPNQILKMLLRSFMDYISYLISINKTTREAGLQTALPPPSTPKPLLLLNYIILCKTVNATKFDSQPFVSSRRSNPVHKFTFDERNLPKMNSKPQPPTTVSYKVQKVEIGPDDYIVCDYHYHTTEMPLYQPRDSKKSTINLINTPFKISSTNFEDIGETSTGTSVPKIHIKLKNTHESESLLGNTFNTNYEESSGIDLHYQDRLKQNNNIHISNIYKYITTPRASTITSKQFFNENIFTLPTFNRNHKTVIEEYSKPTSEFNFMSPVYKDVFYHLRTKEPYKILAEKSITPVHQTNPLFSNSNIIFSLTQREDHDTWPSTKSKLITTTTSKDLSKKFHENGKTEKYAFKQYTTQKTTRPISKFIIYSNNNTPIYSPITNSKKLYEMTQDTFSSKQYEPSNRVTSINISIFRPSSNGKTISSILKTTHPSYSMKHGIPDTVQETTLSSLYNKPITYILNTSTAKGSQALVKATNNYSQTTALSYPSRKTKYIDEELSYPSYLTEKNVQFIPEPVEFTFYHKRFTLFLDSITSKWNKEFRKSTPHYSATPRLHSVIGKTKHVIDHRVFPSYSTEQTIYPTSQNPKGFTSQNKQIISFYLSPEQKKKRKHINVVTIEPFPFATENLSMHHIAYTPMPKDVPKLSKFPSTVIPVQQHEYLATKPLKNFGIYHPTMATTDFLSSTEYSQKPDKFLKFTTGISENFYTTETSNRLSTNSLERFTNSVFSMNSSPKPETVIENPKYYETIPTIEIRKLSGTEKSSYFSTRLPLALRLRKTLRRKSSNGESRPVSERRITINVPSFAVKNQNKMVTPVQRAPELDTIQQDEEIVSRRRGGKPGRNGGGNRGGSRPIRRIGGRPKKKRD
ncbi:hypothetical protein HNY73_008775 [Argiope bruennichi]|uniref:Uncharacterized protein n=1 Tax=Argiope bruennichi TaxID=94029 RepID=A0A8T0FA46_ARGBR|nr:hypothetical protein HNY73_008775 [Argiope bruennichi]